MKASKAWIAAAVLALAIAGLLGVWFTAGWSEVRARQAAERTGPEREAAVRASELSHELRSELGALMTRELERPYFHYQNLFHDPRATRTASVTPSPLAAGPGDPLVLGYFQLDDRGHATTPTVNDELPELSDPTNLAANQRFRAEVTASLAPALTPARTATDAGVVVAEAAVAPSRERDHSQVAQAPREAVSPPTEEPAARGQAEPQARPQIQAPERRVIAIDRNSYAQNWNSNSIYVQENAGGDPQTDDVAPQVTPPDPAPVTPPVVPPRKQVVRRPVPPLVAPAEPATPVMIVVSPLEWRTLEFAGTPSLVAVRQVETPDGALAQGFVVARSELTSWLAARAGSLVAELRTGDDPASEIVPGWHLQVTPNPRTLVLAATRAAQIATSFVIRFLGIGLVAALAAALVVMLVVRAERLARERSQFAAAAAHELRTPLAGLQLYGDMLADGLGDPMKTRDYARRMSEEASRLGRVVSNVLGFSQLERGNLSVEPTVGSRDVELRQLAERAEPALDRAGAVLSLDVAPDLSARFDRDALARIVGNLLDNAEKYGRDASDRTIELAARTAGEAVELVVSDRGPGVSTQARAKLFRPFTRGVPADGPAGLGLGLALSQSLARAMGGELTYRPADGGGAAFVLRLPRT